MGHQINKQWMKVLSIPIAVMLLFIGLFILVDSPTLTGFATTSPFWTGPTEFETSGQFKLDLTQYFTKENTTLTYYTSDADNLSIIIKNKELIVTPEPGFVGEREITIYASGGDIFIEQKITIKVLASEFGVGPVPVEVIEEIVNETIKPVINETLPEVIENMTEEIINETIPIIETGFKVDSDNILRKDNKFIGKRITNGEIEIFFDTIEKTTDKLILEFHHNSTQTENILVEAENFTLDKNQLAPGEKARLEINLIQGIIPKFRLKAGVKKGFAVESQFKEILELGKTIPIVITNGQAKLIDRNDEKLDVEIIKDSGRALIQGVDVETIKAKIDKTTDTKITTEIIAAEPIEIEQAAITLPKTGDVNVIMECTDINVDNMTCPTTWQKTDIPFTENSTHITFIVDHFSGYAGAELEIINVQSYPTVGGNWTVNFTTTGTADLTITAVNQTTWTNYSENSSLYDLKFLELRCGHNILNYTWLNNSVFYPNYFCNQTGTEISKVLTTGKHILKFQFGDDIDYARNLASANLTCQVRNNACNADEVGIMRMSDTSDAHAALINTTDYPYIVCCKDADNRNNLTNSSGTNIVDLSYQTDAHTETAGATDYPHEVYINASVDNISCTYDSVSGSCSSNKTCLFTLSSTTDAHVGDCVTDPYVTTVCCGFEINNRAPNTTQIILNATSINNVTTDNLTCYANATDTDNDTLTFHYGWYKDGTAQPSLEGTSTSGLASNTLHLVATLASGNTSKEEVWFCYVKADDGTDNETGWEDSNNLTIRNTAPTQDDAWIAAHQPSGDTVDTNLVNYWQFEKGSNKSGEAIDSVGVSNGTIYMHEPDYTDNGRIGSGYDFDGSTGYVETFNDNSLDIGTGDFTYSAWFKADSVGTKIIVRSAWSGFATGASVYLSSNNIYCAGRTTTSQEKAAYNAFTDTVDWHHVVCVRENQVMNGYLDGMAFTNNGITGADASLSSHSSTVIGASTDYTYPFNGSIDEVMIYNRSLSVSEIEDIYLSGDINETSTVTTDQDLAAASNNTADIDNDQPTRIYNWYKNGTSITVLNMPFESNKSATTSNLIRDYSPYQNNGTLGGGTVANVPTWTDSGRNYETGAYSFDGINDYINASNAASLDIESSGTVSAWIKVNKLSDAGIITRGSGGSWNDGRLVLLIRSNGRISFTHSNGTANPSSALVNSAVGAITTDQWYYLTATFNGSEAILYLDGAESASNTYSYSPEMSGYNLLIGWWNGLGYFNGTIDEVRIYNHSLSAEQIQAEYDLEYNRIVSQETSRDETWYAEVTLNDMATNTDSATKKTRNATINNKAPTQDTPILNSSLNTNTSNESLTVYPQNVQDEDGDPIKNITNWYMNGTSITALNMPFEGNESKDYSGFSNNGTVTSATWNSTGGYDGKGAYEFDGVNDWINCGSDNSLDFTGDFTIRLWFNAAGLSTWPRILERGNSTDSYQIVHYNNYIYFVVYKAGSRTFEARLPSTTAFDTWYHLVTVYDSGTPANSKMYLDSVDQSLTTTTSHGDIDSSSILRIGRGSIYFNGTIDEVMIFNRSLSSQQILALYQNKTDHIVREETIAGEDWYACLTPNDGYEDGTKKCSDNVTIQTSLPDAPALIIPLNNDSIITPSPEFIWNNSFDADANIITYQIMVDDSAAFDSPEINLTSLPETGSTNTSYDAVVELILDKVYYWKVRGNDSTGYSSFSTTFNFTLVSQLSINLTRNVVNFSQMYINQNNETSDNKPLPFLVENTGNLITNITINGSSLFTQASYPDFHYLFKIGVNETGSFDTGQSTTVYTNINSTGTQYDITNLDWRQTNDTAEIDINITVPGDEPEGVKTSQITLTVS